MSVMVAYTDKGYRAYRTVNGIYRLYLGPSWPTPKEAARYADALEAAPDVSPLRASDEATSPVPGPPYRGPGLTVASSEPLSATLGLEDSPL